MGSTMLATLRWLGVVASLSRPPVSDDNAFAEAIFHTLKYCSEYPSRQSAFLEEAIGWGEAFGVCRNTGHHHSAMRYLPPDNRHFGRREAFLATSVGSGRKAPADATPKAVQA